MTILDIPNVPFMTKSMKFKLHPTSCHGQVIGPVHVFRNMQSFSSSLFYSVKKLIFRLDKKCITNNHLEIITDRPVMRTSSPTNMRLMIASRKVRLILETTEETTSNNGESAMRNYSTYRKYVHRLNSFANCKVYFLTINLC